MIKKKISKEKLSKEKLSKENLLNMSLEEIINFKRTKDHNYLKEEIEYDNQLEILNTDLNNIRKELDNFKKSKVN